ncbi:MAG: PAS domain S-box protein [Halobacteriota archaeon]
MTNENGSNDPDGGRWLRGAAAEVLFEDAPDGIVVHTIEGEIVDVNETLTQTLGYSREQLCSMSVSDIEVGVDAETLTERWRSMSRGAANQDTFEGIHRRADDSTVPVEVRVSRIRPVGASADRFIAFVRDVTERRQREVHLEKSQEVADIGWWRTDIPSDRIYWSERIYDMWGADGDVGLIDHETFMSFIHPEDVDAVESAWEAAMSGDPYDVEHRIVTGDGDLRWMREKADVTFDEDGTPVRAVGIVQDVTDRKERERDLRRYEAFIEHSPTLVTLLDADGTVLFDKSGVDVEWRHPPEEFVGESVFEYVHPADAAAVGETFEELVSTPDAHRSIEFRFRARDGQWRWLRSHTVNRLADPLIGGIIVNSTDVTERKRYELELERHRTYLENTSDMLTVIDPDGTIEYVSPAVERILGYDPDELIGQNGFEYVHPDDLDARIADVEALADTPGADTVFEYRFRRPDGSYCWIESTARNLLEDPEVGGLLLSSRDITERKAHEQQLSALHTATRRFIDAESKVEVAEIAVEAAEELLEFSLPSVWFSDDDGSELRLVANSEEHQALLDSAGTPSPVHPRDSWLWEPIDTSETVVRHALEREDLSADVPLRSVIVLPLGDHGVLGCASDEDVEFSDRQIRVAEILARNVLVALDQLEQRIALERQTEFTANVLDAIEDVVYVLDTDGELLEYNDALTTISGYEEAAIESMHVTDFFSDADAETAETVVSETFETGRSRAELPIVTAAGEPIPYEFIANAFEGPDGEPILAGIGRDRSHHLEYERALESERDFLETVIDSLPYPFYVLDVADYSIELANDHASVAEGDTCYEITHKRAQPCDEGDGETVACPLSAVVESGEPSTVEHVHYDEAGEERVHMVYAAPIREADGTVVRMAESTIDITDRVTYERQLEEQRDSLEILNQVVRHDIRNDMTVVRGRANLLSEHVDSAGEEHLEPLLRATENAIELTTLARDLAETMLSTEADVEPVGLAGALEQPIETTRSTYDEAVLTVDDAIPDVVVRGNDLLEAVFRNVLQNAIVHNDNAIPAVHVSTTLTDDTVTVAIADNGPGIPDAQKESIFGKGEKGLDSPGTGIGLYLVQTLVDQFGGRVWVEDRSEAESIPSVDRADDDASGSVFFVELPRVE